MNLIIDLGNTQAKLAFFREDKLVKTHISPVLTPALLKKVMVSPSGKKAKAVILSSVIHHSPRIENILTRLPLFIRLSHHTPLPVKNRYKTPRTLGYDRLASAIGGCTRFPGRPVLVIDAGTCIKYNFINAKGNFIGGSITPGVAMRFQSMNRLTDKLPLVRKIKSRQPLTGSSTASSLATGVLNGILYEMQGFMDDYAGKFPGLRIILTGGDASLFAGKLKSDIFVIPQLVLIGLNEILKHNLRIEKGY